jgi:hypothetical protein
MPPQDRVPDNPSGETFRTMPDDGARYRVTSNTKNFGPNDVVSARDLGEGAQIQRLIDLGVIVAMTQEQIDALNAPAPALDARLSPEEATGGHEIASKKAEDQMEAGEVVPETPASQGAPQVAEEQSDSPRRSKKS